MRIVLMNWARIWEGASSGGGVNQYAQALAIELVKRGHEVSSVISGQSYVPVPPAPSGGAFVRRHDDWMNTKVFEVINSPVMAPSIVQFAEPLGEVSAPELEELVGRLMSELKPDAVHWNNIEGFSAGCIGVIRRVCPQARQVFSLHNYHTICPQVYLMQGHRRTCWSFDNGHSCTNCIEVRRPEEHRAEIEQKWQSAWQRGVEEEKHAWHMAKTNLKRVWTGARKIREAEARARGVVPGSPVALGGGEGASGDIGLPVLSAKPPVGVDERGMTAQLRAELNPWKPPAADAPELQALSNEIRPEVVSEKAPNDYARRRSAMVEMLNGCDLVLAVSEFVRRKFVSMGVKEGVIETMAIGSRINRVIALKPDLVFDPPKFEARPAAWNTQRPLRLHFMGYNNYYKGLHVLAEALEMLSVEHLRQVDLSIFALDGQTIEWMFRRLEPRLARLHFGYAYTYHDIPWMLGGRDLTVVPSVWWDNAPQTVFESLSCGVPVLGANIGGIPDFVRHGENGILFAANSRAGLAEAIRGAIEDPWMVEGLRANVRPTKSIEEHVVEMEGVYGGRA